MLKGISVLIVNYNGAVYLKDCIQSLHHTLQQSAIPFEILLIDNASSDSSAEILKRFENEYAELQIHWSATNLGFSAANNVLAKQAKYESLMLLNNDTRVLRLNQLLSCYKQTGLDAQTVYTGTLLNPDLSVQKNGFNYPNLKSIAAGLYLIKPILYPILKYIIKPKSSNYDYYSGCYLVISNVLFEELGGFDEQFYFYHEECDLFLRMDKKGIKKIVFHQDQIIHFGGGGGEISDFSFIQYYVNLARLLLKHGYATKPSLEKLFTQSFAFRIFFAKLKLNIPYEPSGHVYLNAKIKRREPHEVISLHQETLTAIIQAIHAA